MNCSADNIYHRWPLAITCITRTACHSGWMLSWSVRYAGHHCRRWTIDEFANGTESKTSLVDFLIFNNWNSFTTCTSGSYWGSSCHLKLFWRTSAYLKRNRSMLLPLISQLKTHMCATKAFLSIISPGGAGLVVWETPTAFNAAKDKNNDQQLQVLLCHLWHIAIVWGSLVLWCRKLKTWPIHLLRWTRLPVIWKSKQYYFHRILCRFVTLTGCFFFLMSSIFFNSSKRNVFGSSGFSWANFEPDHRQQHFLCRLCYICRGRTQNFKESKKIVLFQIKHRFSPWVCISWHGELK